MWYVIQVLTGKEDDVVSHLQKTLPAGLALECFNPCYEVNKKVRGSWHTVARPMFPGYVIVDTCEPAQVAGCIKRLPNAVRILGNGDAYVPLARNHMEWIGGFTSKEHRVIKTSSGVIEGDRVMVTDGPLVGMESCIKKIDRHKRLAFAEFDLCGRTVLVKLGLSIVRRVDGPAASKAMRSLR